MEKEKKQKYLFHASKVDRIAIVDRPAVPDAEILVFKRRTDEDGNDQNTHLAKAMDGIDFAREFTGAKVQAAVQVLESTFWATMYFEEGDKIAAFKKNMKSFKGVLVELINEVPQESAEKAEKPDVNELMGNFKRGLEVSVISEAFTYFKQSVYSLVAQAGLLSNSVQIAKAMVDTFEEFVISHAETIATKSNKSIVVDKEGRIISTARLRKIKQALETLTQLVEEATPKTKREEEVEMDEKMIQEIIEKALTPILEDMKGMREILTQKGIIEKELSADEQKAKDEADAKAKEEADAKAKEDADAKAEAEKKAKEEQEAKEKAFNELKEKAEKAETELTDLKKKYEVVEKAITAFEKRTGRKVSLDVEESTEKKESKDPFREAMKA